MNAPVPAIILHQCGRRRDLVSSPNGSNGSVFVPHQGGPWLNHLLLWMAPCAWTGPKRSIVRTCYSLLSGEQERVDIYETLHDKHCDRNGMKWHTMAAGGNLQEEQGQFLHNSLLRTGPHPLACVLIRFNAQGDKCFTCCHRLSCAASLVFAAHFGQPMTAHTLDTLVSPNWRKHTESLQLSWSRSPLPNLQQLKLADPALSMAPAPSPRPLEAGLWDSGSTTRSSCQQRSNRARSRVFSINLERSILWRVKGPCEETGCPVLQHIGLWASLLPS